MERPNGLVPEFDEMTAQADADYERELARMLAAVFDIGKSDGLMDEPKSTRSEIEAVYPIPGSADAYQVGYRAGVKEDGR